MRQTPAIFRWLMAAVIFLCVGFTALSQTGNTSLRGTVTDPKGASVVGATVTITNSAIAVTLTTTTDKDGAYQFQEVRPATYDVSVACDLPHHPSTCVVAAP